MIEYFTAGIADHAAAIRQLGKRHPWLDADRVGIYGASWGGYFTLAALLFWLLWKHGCARSAPACRARHQLPNPSITCCDVGIGLPASSKTEGFA